MAGQVYTNALNVGIFIVTTLYFAMSAWLVATRPTIRQEDLQSQMSQNVHGEFATMSYWSLVFVVAAAINLGLWDTYRLYFGHRMQSHNDGVVRCIVKAVLIELTWELLQASSSVGTLRVDYPDGRIRSIYPMRFAVWGTCNACIVSALTSVLELPPSTQLYAVLGVTLSVFMVLPLELLVIGSYLWIGALILSYVLFVYSGCLVAGGIANALARSSSRIQSATLVILCIGVILSWCSVPVLFHVAQFCGGEFNGVHSQTSCLSNIDEIWWWHALPTSFSALFAICSQLARGLRLTPTWLLLC
jgi:hypothetical protein